MKTEGYAIAKSDLGDVYARKVYYVTDSGRVLMKKIEPVKHRTIYERESAYQYRIAEEPAIQQSDITLFWYTCTVVALFAGTPQDLERIGNG